MARIAYHFRRKVFHAWKIYGKLSCLFSDNIQKLLHIQYDEKIKHLQFDSAEDIRKYREELDKIKEQRQKEVRVDLCNLSKIFTLKYSLVILVISLIYA